jgi:hypothetical protein
MFYCLTLNPKSQLHTLSFSDSWYMAHSYKLYPHYFELSLDYIFIIKKWRFPLAKCAVKCFSIVLSVAGFIFKLSFFAIMECARGTSTPL